MRADKSWASSKDRGVHDVLGNDEDLKCLICARGRRGGGEGSIGRRSAVEYRLTALRVKLTHDPSLLGLYGQRDISVTSDTLSILPAHTGIVSC